MSFFSDFVFVVVFAALVVVDVVLVDDANLGFVVVVVIYIWSPVALAKKAIVLKLCENLSPVARGILVQEEKLQEFGVGYQMPEVAVECHPLIFGDEQIPCHQEGDEEGGEEEIFDPDDSLEIGSNCASNQGVNDDDQRTDHYEETLSHSKNST